MFKTRKNRSPIGTQNLHIAEIQEFDDDLPPMEEVERIRNQHPDAAMASVLRRMGRTDEAIAVVESDPVVEPCGYGLGRHGWISFPLPAPLYVGPPAE